jgi:RNA polymerase-interacting CarD/CdnL/TRCF family regulator
MTKEEIVGRLTSLKYKRSADKYLSEKDRQALDKAIKILEVTALE